MADTSRPRAGFRLAFILHELSLKRLVGRLRPKPKGLQIGQISDHLARDIGLSDAEIERHRIRLPSQTSYHPRG